MQRSGLGAKALTRKQRLLEQSFYLPYKVFSHPPRASAFIQVPTLASQNFRVLSPRVGLATCSSPRMPSCNFGTRSISSTRGTMRSLMKASERVWFCECVCVRILRSACSTRLPASHLPLFQLLMRIQATKSGTLTHWSRRPPNSCRRRTESSFQAHPFRSSFLFHPCCEVLT